MFLRHCAPPEGAGCYRLLVVLLPRSRLPVRQGHWRWQRELHLLHPAIHRGRGDFCSFRPGASEGEVQILLLGGMVSRLPRTINAPSADAARGRRAAVFAGRLAVEAGCRPLLAETAAAAVSGAMALVPSWGWCVFFCRRLVGSCWLLAPAVVRGFLIGLELFVCFFVHAPQGILGCFLVIFARRFFVIDAHPVVKRIVFFPCPGSPAR